MKDPCILEALGELTALGVLPSLTTIRTSSYIPAMFEDSALRLLIYDEIVRTGETPVVVTLTRLVGASLDDVRASLRRCLRVIADGGALNGAPASAGQSNVKAVARQIDALQHNFRVSHGPAAHPLP